jgi:hypothetical protein
LQVSLYAFDLARRSSKLWAEWRGYNNDSNSSGRIQPEFRQGLLRLSVHAYSRVVGFPANSRTPIEFLPGLPALQKGICIFLL